MLLRPFLNKRATMLLTRLELDAETAEDYGKVKEYLLREMKLTPRVYLEKFQSLTEVENDTYVLFGHASRQYSISIWKVVP